MATRHLLFLAGPCHCALRVLGLVSPGCNACSPSRCSGCVSANSSTIILKSLWKKNAVEWACLSLALTWQIEIRRGQSSYCCEWFVVTSMSVGFSLLPLTGSSKIHFKLILKVRSETNCIVTGEKCHWRNALGLQQASELIHSDKDCPDVWALQFASPCWGLPASLLIVPSCSQYCNALWSALRPSSYLRFQVGKCRIRPFISFVSLLKQFAR